MGRVGASLELPYPQEPVFRVATRIEDLPKWLPEVVSASLLDPPLAVGSRVRLKLSAAAAGTEVVGQVRQLRSPSILVIGGSGGPLTVEVRARLDPVSEAATRIALEIDLSTSPLLGFIAREAERRINAELPASLERFRALMEADGA
jgi:polyketide cyclase/dehydrase/lipid transport protein